MKKVIRLTESDLVKIVKRVIKENRQVINEGPLINIDWGGSYKGHTVKSLNVVQNGKPYLDVIMKDGSSKRYKVTTKLGDVNLDKIWMDGDKLGVSFYSGGGGQTTSVIVPGHKTYDLFEKLKNKPYEYELVSDKWTDPNILFVTPKS